MTRPRSKRLLLGPGHRAGGGGGRRGGCLPALLLAPLLLLLRHRARPAGEPLGSRLDRPHHPRGWHIGRDRRPEHEGTGRPWRGARDNTTTTEET